MLDNSPFYQNEGFVGEAIRASGIPRSSLYLSSKFDHVNDESVEVEFQKSLDNVRDHLHSATGARLTLPPPTARR